MKAYLLYFSGTGNTYYVAKKISDMLNKRNCFTEIHSIEEKLPMIADSFDILILGCPKYYEYPVVEFIKYIEDHLPINHKKIPAMMFCTQVAYLETNFNEIEKILKKKNYKLIVTKSFPIANNMVIFDSFPLTAPEKVNENLIKLEGEIKYLLTCLMTGKESKEKTKVLFNQATYVSGYLFTKLFAWFGVKYSTSNSCNGCGLCAKKCPVGNIKMHHKTPQFNKNCIFCMRCINGCPNNAIQYNHKTCKQYKSLKVSE